jgi:hypothetical protein
MARAVREHAAIAAAIESGDSAGAAAAMGAHLNGLLIDIPDVRRLNPEYFADNTPAGRTPTDDRRNGLPQEKQRRGEGWKGARRSQLGRGGDLGGA